ncbi:MAG: ATP-binding protein, partial [Candidatus Omnitrophica bacterium]|nr:ATP-binding protein [Candidatus Omnitrophota bacterium]
AAALLKFENTYFDGQLTRVIVTLAEKNPALLDAIAARTRTNVLQAIFDRLGFKANTLFGGPSAPQIYGLAQYLRDNAINAVEATGLTAKMVKDLETLVAGRILIELLPENRNAAAKNNETTVNTIEEVITVDEAGIEFNTLWTRTVEMADQVLARAEAISGAAEAVKGISYRNLIDSGLTDMAANAVNALAKRWGASLVNAQLTIRATVAAGRVTFELIDNGIGLSEEQIAVIGKDRYTSRGASDSRTYIGGEGTFIYTWTAIARLTGGELTLGNREDAQGAVLRLVLPVAEAAAKQTKTQAKTFEQISDVYNDVAGIQDLMVAARGQQEISRYGLEDISGAVAADALAVRIAVDYLRNNGLEALAEQLAAIAAAGGIFDGPYESFTETAYAVDGNEYIVIGRGFARAPADAIAAAIQMASRLVKAIGETIANRRVYTSEENKARQAALINTVTVEGIKETPARGSKPFSNEDGFITVPALITVGATALITVAAITYPVATAIIAGGFATVLLLSLLASVISRRGPPSRAKITSTIKTVIRRVLPVIVFAAVLLTPTMALAQDTAAANSIVTTAWDFFTANLQNIGYALAAGILGALIYRVIIRYSTDRRLIDEDTKLEREMNEFTAPVTKDAGEMLEASRERYSTLRADRMRTENREDRTVVTIGGIVFVGMMAIFPLLLNASLLTTFFIAVPFALVFGQLIA